MIEVPQYFQKKLHDNEEVRLFLRPYGLVYFWWFLLSFILLFASLYYLLFFLRFGWWGKMILLVVFTLGVFSLLKTIIVWRLTAVVVTNQRIIDFDQYGIFVRKLSEAPFHNIQDITLEQKGLFPVLLNFGTVKVQTAGSSVVLELQNIRYPRDIHEELVAIRAEAQAPVSSQTAVPDWTRDARVQNLFVILEKKKEELGEDKFAEAIDEWLNQKK